MKTDQEKLQLCSKRLRKLRNEVGLTIDELRVEMETKNNAKYSNSAYCRWENAQRMPPIDIMEAFADYFGVSAEWLIGDSDIMDQIIIVNRRDEILLNKKQGFKSAYVPKENLYLYRGEPVWMAIKGGVWALVSKNEDALILANGEKLSFFSLQHAVYRVPIPYCYAVDAVTDPISFVKLNQYEHIWVEPISTDYANRQRDKGWCTKGKDKNEYKNPITNKTYKLSEYGVTWVAYEDIID